MSKTFQDLMQSLSSVTVEQLNDEIAKIDKKITETVEPLQRERDAMIQLRRIVSAREVGAPQRKPRAPKTRKEPPAPSGIPPVAVKPSTEIASKRSDLPTSEAIRVFLDANGPSRPKIISAGTGIEYQTVYSCLSTRADLFKKLDTGEYANR